MSKNKSIDNIRNHKDTTISILDGYMELLLSNDPKKADLLSYWLHTYVNYLKFETTFDPKKNKNYERGDIVRVNLGFNIGSEHGGRHYAVVLDNNNHHASPVITIIPLSSSDGSNVHSSSVYLGDDIYQKINAKVKGLRQAYRSELSELSELKSSIAALLKTDVTDEKLRATAQANIALLGSKSADANQREKDLRKLQSEVARMKSGSVALVGQITTISKIRIEDPVNIHGALDGIKISSDNLDKIDAKILELFLKKKK